MRRTTVFLPQELQRDLQIFARRTGRPAASIVREAIAAYIVASPPGPALPSFAGTFDSGHTDTADRHEELLFAGLTPHGERSAPASRRTTSQRQSRKLR